jgi:A/G-specific adenine glycosylase
VLLVENAAGELLFERRPPAGIWGGLWCLPVLDGAEDAAAWLARERGLQAQQLESLPPLRHGFTHFELQLEPLRLRLTGDASGLREQAGQRWINMAADTLPGLPAPVARLLARLRHPPQPDPQQALALEPAPAIRRGRPRKAAASSS